MRYIIVLIMVLFLSSCINTQPFRVGEDVDAGWQLRNLPELQDKVDIFAKSLCPVIEGFRVAVCDFIDLNSGLIDENGRYVAFLVSNRLNSECRTTAYYVGKPRWFAYKGNIKIKDYMLDKYRFAVVGSYRYENNCYDVFARLVDLYKGVVYKTYTFVVGEKGVNFSIEPLSIPNEVIIP